jgi:hypothetical protein
LDDGCVTDCSDGSAADAAPSVPPAPPLDASPPESDADVKADAHVGPPPVGGQMDGGGSSTSPGEGDDAGGEGADPYCSPGIACNGIAACIDSCFGPRCCVLSCTCSDESGRLSCNLNCY